MKIISVNITKGGCGKTTTVQITGELLTSEHGKKVLCIDTDPQCNLTIASGINPMECQEHNLYTLLKDESDIEDCIKKTKYYDIIPGSLLLAYADTEFNHLGREYFLKEKIENLDYDYILIDTPPSLGLLNIMSLTASTNIIIPTECSYLAMVGLDQLSNTINSVRKHSNKNLVISGILMIKYSKRTNVDQIIRNGLDKMSAQLETSVFKTQIRETRKIKEAQVQKQPLIEWDPSCTAVIDYQQFVKELIDL